jgi:hypothetical protein
VIDFLFFALYAVAVRLTNGAVIPAIAFLVSSIIFYIDGNIIYSHLVYAVIYLALIPFAKTPVAFGMLASSAINLLAALYFASPLYLDNYPLYFLIAMIGINTYILISIYRGLEDGELGGIYRNNYNCRVGNGNLHAFEKEGERRS